MKKNIIIVILILIIILLVEGYVFYLRQQPKDLSNDTAINNPSEENPVEENNSTDCLLTSPASIKVISPNGGEIFTTGQKINVKWESCNISDKDQIFVQLAQGLAENEYGEGPGGIEGIPYFSLNDGNETVNLPSEMFDPTKFDSFSSGRTNFRIQVTLSSNDKIFDYSDDLFTIKKELTTANCPIGGQVFFDQSCTCPAPWNIKIGNLQTGFNCVGMPKDNL